MDTEIIVALLSGQFILVLWQVYKEIVEHREQRKAKRERQQDQVEELREMVFGMYRTNIKTRISDMYHKIDNDAPEVTIELSELRNDLKTYLASGGNGSAKAKYIRLCDYAREKKGEHYYNRYLSIDELEEEN